MWKDSNFKLQVLIPDGDTLLSLSVVRCLSEVKNISIHIVSRKKWVETRFSNKIDSFSHFRKSKSNLEFIDFLTEIVENKNINVILPVHYPAIRLLSAYRHIFDAKSIKLFTSPVDQLDLANDKGTLAKLLLSFGISHPTTTELSCLESDDKLNYPFLIKPKTGWNGNKIFKVNNKIDFLKICSEIPDKNKYLIQNYILGYDIDMSVLCENGKILNYTIQKGYLNSEIPFQAPMGIEFSRNDEIFKSVKKMMMKLNWSGVAHIDLRYDELTKKFLVIEINPRFWGSVQGSSKVGVNFPYLYCLASLGRYSGQDSGAYKLESYVNNRGLIKILQSKFKTGSKKKLKFPNNSPLKEDFLDPLPKSFKYLEKLFLKFNLKKSLTRNAIVFGVHRNNVQKKKVFP